jgi:hypothetical protein
VTLAYYFDEDIMNRNLVQAMRLRGLDVVTALEAATIHRSDEAHLEFAAEHGRVTCSFNAADFARIHREWLSLGRNHAGILLVQQLRRYSVGTQLRALLRLSAELNATEMTNRLVFLSNWV